MRQGFLLFGPAENQAPCRRLSTLMCGLPGSGPPSPHPALGRRARLRPKSWCPARQEHRLWARGRQAPQHQHGTGEEKTRLARWRDPSLCACARRSRQTAGAPWMVKQRRARRAGAGDGLLQMLGRVQTLVRNLLTRLDRCYGQAFVTHLPSNSCLPEHPFQGNVAARLSDLLSGLIQAGQQLLGAREMLTCFEMSISTSQEQSQQWVSFCEAKQVSGKLRRLSFQASAIDRQGKQGKDALNQTSSTSSKRYRT
jgi:hypothetical protein